MELTYEKLFKVAIRLDKKCDIRKLGFKLGVEEHKIDTIFTNKKDDIEEAVYGMLKEWRKGQRDNKEAYTNLWAALTHPDVNLRSVTHEALESDCGIRDDYDDVQRKREQQEEIRHANRRNLNHYETPESGIRESHPDDGIQLKILEYDKVWKDVVVLRKQILKVRALMDHHLDELAAKLDKDDLERLGKQLEIFSTEIDTIFAKHCPPAKEPILKVLKTWLNRQTDRHEAYITMGEALTHPDVGLNLIAKEVLDYPPAKIPSRPSATCADSVSRECAQCEGTHVSGVVASC